MLLSARAHRRTGLLPLFQPGQTKHTSLAAESSGGCYLSPPPVPGLSTRRFEFLTWRLQDITA